MKKQRMTLSDGAKTVRANGILKHANVEPHGINWLWLVLECPYCGRRHAHGVKGGIDANPFTALGMRTAHCDEGTKQKYYLAYGGLAAPGQDDKKSGYIYLSDPAPWLAKVRAEVKQMNQGTQHE